MKLKHLNRLVPVLPLLVFILKLSHAEKILVILPIPFQEHQAVFQPLIESLHKHEHEITIMTTNPIFSSRDSMTFKNITEIDLSFVYNLGLLDELRNVDLEGSDMLKTVFNVMRKIFEGRWIFLPSFDVK